MTYKEAKQLRVGDTVWVKCYQWNGKKDRYDYFPQKEKVNYISTRRIGTPSSCYNHHVNVFTSLLECQKSIAKSELQIKNWKIQVLESKVKRAEEEIKKLRKSIPSMRGLITKAKKIAAKIQKELEGMK